MIGIKNELRPLAGRRFTDLLVLKRGRKHKRNVYWLCRCICGAEKDVRADHLVSGRVKSCGSHKGTIDGRVPVMTPGRSRSYKSWSSMQERCLNPRSNNYSSYGGRGITFAAEWDSFEAFYRDMGDRPIGLTLGRRDNNLGYSKDNCRWEIGAEQARNRQNTRRVEWQGQTWLLIELCEVLGVRYSPVNARLRTGWDLATALSRPIRPKVPNRTSTAVQPMC
jgi:hypothetical protein